MSKHTCTARGAPGKLPVVILSPEAWNDTAPTNKHQLARQFARDSESLFIGVSGRSARLGGPWPPLAYREVEPGLTVCEVLAIPERLQLMLGTVAACQEWLAMLAVRRFVTHRRGWDSFAVLAYFPYSRRSIRSLGARVLAYHCVDQQASFPQLVRQRRRISRNERKLVRDADVVIASSSALGEHCRAWRPDVHVMPNVGDIHLFGRLARIVPPKRPWLLMFFHGTFSAHKVDYGFLRDIAAACPEVRLRLVGRVNDDFGRSAFAELCARPNVEWLDARPQADVIKAMAGAHVLLLPYALNAHTQYVFPLKLTEYLATGRPIVGTRLRSVTEFCGERVAYADNGGEAVHVAKDLLANDDREASRRRRGLVEGRTWERRGEEIRALLLRAADLHQPARGTK